MNRSHTKYRALRLMADKFIRLTFDNNLRIQMRNLWLRKKVTSDIESLGEFYEEAFEQYLLEVKIPKQMQKITRTTAKLRVPEHVADLVKQLQKIAAKRQQPVAVIIEEALQRYLDKPENYLGKGHQMKERLERLG